MLFCKAVTVDPLMFFCYMQSYIFNCFSQAGTRKDISVIMPDFSCPLVHLDAFPQCLCSRHSADIRIHDLRNSFFSNLRKSSCTD